MPIPNKRRRVHILISLTKNPLLVLLIGAIITNFLVPYINRARARLDQQLDGIDSVSTAFGAYSAEVDGFRDIHENALTNIGQINQVIGRVSTAGRGLKAAIYSNQSRLLGVQLNQDLADQLGNLLDSYEAHISVLYDLIQTPGFLVYETNAGQSDLVDDLLMREEEIRGQMDNSLVALYSSSLRTNRR